MRHYIPKSTGLPENLARQVFWLIRDYDRMKVAYDNAIWDSPDPPDGQPRGNNAGDPTSREAMKRAELFKKMKAVEQAKFAIPEKYREGVWNHVVHDTPYPANADRTTYWIQKTKFFKRVAKNLNWI